MRAAVQDSLLLISGLLAALGVLAHGRRTFSLALRRLRRRHEEAVRPHLLAALAAEADAGPPPPLSRGQRASLERLARRWILKLRGEDRGALIALLEAHGALEAARRATRSGLLVRRGLAAELLGAVADAGSLVSLTQLLADRDGDVRHAAARALGRVGDPAAVGPLLDALERPAGISPVTATMALARLDAPAIPELRASLSLHGPLARTVAAETLGMLGAVEAAPDLIGLLGDRDPSVRRAAAAALGRIGRPQAIPRLVTAVGDDRSPAVRRAATRSLGEIGGTAAIVGLRAALTGDDPHLALVAAGALARLGEAGPSVLRTTAATPGPGAGPAREALAQRALAAAAERERPR